MSGLALAIGKFDALHLGHQALAKRAASLGEPALLGFTGMAEVLGWTARSPLVAASDRSRILATWSEAVGAPVGERMLPFADIQPLTPAGFIAELRKRLTVSALVVGDDFRFGRGRAAGAFELRDLAERVRLPVAIVPPVRAGDALISSTRVRDALSRGDCQDVAACLGRPHRLVGRVARGDGRGRTLGFPTANCAAWENQPPGPGVYAARAWVDDRGPFPAAVNAGHLPTVGGGRPFTVEAHLIGFDDECYDARLALDFVARLRDERQFDGLDELRAQLRRDVEMAVAVVALGVGG